MHSQSCYNVDICCVKICFLGHLFLKVWHEDFWLDVNDGKYQHVIIPCWTKCNMHAHGQTTQKNFGELNIVDCVIALLNPKWSLQIYSLFTDDRYCTVYQNLAFLFRGGLCTIQNALLYISTISVFNFSCFLLPLHVQLQ